MRLIELPAKDGTPILINVAAIANIAMVFDVDEFSHSEINFIGGDFVHVASINNEIIDAIDQSNTPLIEAARKASVALHNLRQLCDLGDHDAEIGALVTELEALIDAE